MADVAASSAVALDAHLSRCRSLREVIGFAMRHGQTPDDESALSGLQLIHMKTLADHLAALDHTIQAHRPPVVLPTDAMERIERKVDLLAGMVAGLLGQVSNESEVAA